MAIKGEKLLLAVLLAGVVIRTWILPMFSSLWIDEWAVYWIGHEGPWHLEEFGRQFIADQRLMSLAAWLGMQVFGNNEFGLRFYSLLSGCFCLVAIHQLCRRWFDQRTALYATVLFPCFISVYQQANDALAGPLCRLQGLEEVFRPPV